VHLGKRAVGGAGLIITESASINPMARSTNNNIGIWKYEHINKWQLRLRSWHLLLLFPLP
jgi:2,4-dienoyl-CoA reductase-like NADH-dependent reductase (Old Yellow Enzyme family)